MSADDATAEAFGDWPRELLVTTIISMQSQAFDAFRAAVRYREEVDRLVTALGRSREERTAAANRARRKRREILASQASDMRAVGRSVPYIAEKLEITERRVYQLLKSRNDDDVSRNDGEASST